MLTQEEKRNIWLKAFDENKEYVEKRTGRDIEKYRKGDCRVRLTDKDGNQLLKNIWRSECYHSREVPMTATRSTFDKDAQGNLSTLYADVEALAGQGNTIEISLQIATGEKLIAFRGELTN